MEEEKKYKKVSYWSVVWSQFKKNKIALWGLGAIVLLLLQAIYSPFLSLDVPIVYSIDGKMHCPFLLELFNKNRFENTVDILFNAVMVVSPLLVALWFVCKKIFSISTNKTFVIFIAFVILVCFAASIVSEKLVKIGNRKYKEEIAIAKSEGKKVSAIFPLMKWSYKETDLEGSNPQAPSAKHLLGTDSTGRDVLTRMLYGTRISMTIGVVAVSIYMLIGIVLGALAGYFGGAIDIWISRLIEVVICFPTFFLILTLAAFIEKRTVFHVMILIGVVSWTGVARLVRGEFLRQRGMDYVQAAIALGISRAKIIFTHILPNAMGPILVSATFGIASAILTESSLSFLGLGDPTAPSWGGILNIGRQQGKLWLILAPGFAIFFVVSVFNLVGEAIRDAMDPRLRQ